MPILTFHPGIDRPAAGAAVLQFDPSGFDLFAASTAESFQDSTVVALVNLIRAESAERSGPQISEEQWKESPHFRKGLKFEEGFTQEKAALLAVRHDRLRMRQFTLSRGEGFGDTLAILAGAFAGAIPDPVNFIPLVGPLSRTRLLLRLGQTSRRAMFGAVEAGAAVGVAQPLIAARRRAFQEDFDLEMAAWNVSMALALGAGFGAIGSRIARIIEKRRVLAMNKAVDDVISDRPVDVGPILGNQESATPLVKAAARGNVSRETQEFLDALAKPGFLRTAEERLILQNRDIPPLVREAADALNKPGFLRTAEELSLLRAFAGDAEEEFLKTRLVDLTERVKVAEGKPEQRLLEIERESTEAKLTDMKEDRPLDHSVAAREELELPEAPPSRPGAPPEKVPDLPEITARVDQLIADEKLAPDELRDLAIAKELAAKSDTYADAYLAAAACMVNQVT